MSRDINQNIPNGYGNGILNKGYMADPDYEKSIKGSTPPTTPTSVTLRVPAIEIKGINDSEDSELSRYLKSTRASNPRNSFSLLPPPPPSSTSTRSITRRLSSMATSASKQRKFTQQERKILQSFSSVNYSPNHSMQYMEWLGNKNNRFQADRWFIVILIGIVIGLTACLQKQCLQTLDKVKWTQTKEFARENDIIRSWGWAAIFSILFALISSVLVTFVNPPSGGSGVPEVLAFLNGVIVHNTLNLKNFIVKFIANVFSVSSGMPAAIQGPMIALGAIVGAGLGQFKSNTLGIAPKIFARLRNAEDRRSFTTAGVAAGVSAAFNAPIGGLLFAMEDLSSFWSRKLSWQTFFCSGIASFTASLFNSAYNGFTLKEGAYFGIFNLSITEPIRMHILALVPAIILGIIGGLLGALFTRTNVAIVGLRKRWLAAIPNDLGKKIVKVVEVLMIALIMCTTAVWLPQGLGCTTLPKEYNQTLPLKQCGLLTEFNREINNCNTTDPDMIAYSEVATLMQGSGLAFLDKLSSRGTHRWFSYSSLLSILPIWFFMTIWTCGAAQAGGIFVPNLVSGALYGRALGLALVDWWTVYNPIGIPIGDTQWEWLDPGVMAAIGAGSLLGGVTRLNLAITVIVVEMSQDIDILIPTLVAIFVAKIIADLLAKPLYQYQLDGKVLPYLDAEPKVVVNDHIANLELYQAGHVMASPVITLHATESVAHLANQLASTDHCGFPVVTYDDDTRSELLHGLITRVELYVILCNNEVYEESRPGAVLNPKIDYQDLSVDYISDPSAAEERVKMYTKFNIYQNIFINLEPFINISIPKVDQCYSLHRTYQLYRTLGLRHLVVTDDRNRVVGIITRKDLMTFNIEEKLEELHEKNGRRESDVTTLPALTISTIGGSIKEEDEGEVEKHDDHKRAGDTHL